RRGRTPPPAPPRRAGPRGGRAPHPPPPPPRRDGHRRTAEAEPDGDLARGRVRDRRREQPWAGELGAVGGEAALIGGVGEEAAEGGAEDGTEPRARCAAGQHEPVVRRRATRGREPEQVPPSGT